MDCVQYNTTHSHKRKGALWVGKIGNQSVPFSLSLEEGSPLRGKERRTIVGIELREWCVRGCCTAVWPLLCPFFGRRVGPPPFLLFLSFPMPFVQLLLSVTLSPPFSLPSPSLLFLEADQLAALLLLAAVSHRLELGGPQSPHSEAKRKPRERERESVVFSTYFMSQASLVCVTV